MKFLKVALIVVLVVGLVVGLALPVMAKPENKGTQPEMARVPPVKIVTDKVIEIDPDKTFFVIQKANQQSVKVTVNNGTKYYKLPARPRALAADMGIGMGKIRQWANHIDSLGQEASFEDIEIGNRVIVQLAGNESLAKVVLIIKPGLAMEMLRGKVVEIDPGKTFFVIEKANQESVKITVNDSTKYYEVTVPLKVGKLMWRGASAQITETGLSELANEEDISESDIEVLGRLGQKATFDDLKIGDSVIVRVEQGELLAKLVLILRPAAGRVTGTITALDTVDKTLTITPAGGTPVNLKYGDNTTFILRGITAVAVGQLAQAAYRSADMMATIVRVPPPTPTPEPLAVTQQSA